LSWAFLIDFFKGDVVVVLSDALVQEKALSAYDLFTLMGRDMQRVDNRIQQLIYPQIPLIAALAAHLINAGGKRLRPLLTLACAKMCGYENGEDDVSLATAVEFIHTATLLHDDVVDGSHMRRGQEAANVIWGNQASVLVGDFLFSKSFELMVETKSLSALETLSKASSTIAEGEVLQLSIKGTIPDQDTYFQVITAKTATLFAAACRVGGIVAGQTPRGEQALWDFGLHFGIAFQLIDDALDYFGASENLGKSVGDDFREGKVTLPVICAYERGNDEEKTFWRTMIEIPSTNPDDFEKAVTFMRSHESLLHVMNHAFDHTQKALAALSLLPPCDIRQALEAMVQTSLHRIT
jgi:octaprenyl-diphosphate synthase